MIQEYVDIFKNNKNHVLPVKMYFFIFFILVGLTIITIFCSKLDFGSFSILIAVFLASIKSFLVFSFFMHLWFDNKFYVIIIITSIFVLSLFIGVIILDVSSRDLLDQQKANFLPRNEKMENS